MRVLIDSLVVATRCDFVLELEANIADSSVATFDPFASPADVGVVLQAHQPDVLVVHPTWFLASGMLQKLLHASNCSHTRRVVASTMVDDVVKVKAAYNGFFDVLDLDEPMESLVDALRQIHAGTSRLAADRMWATVSRPGQRTDIAAAMLDQVDHTIIDLVSLGLSDQEIAHVVHLSRQTVRNRISKMLERSDLNNRTQMAWMHTSQVLVEVMVANMNARRGTA